MIELLPFTMDDAQELISRIKDQRMLLQFAGPAYHFPLTEQQLEKDLTDEYRILFKILDLDSRMDIGHAQLFLKEDTFLLGRILIWDENNRGKGYGKEVVRKLLEYGFGRFVQEIAELNVYDWNSGAIACYEKVGFTIDPEIRSEVRIENETWCSINMKINREIFKLQES